MTNSVKLALSGAFNIICERFKRLSMNLGVEFYSFGGSADVTDNSFICLFFSQLEFQ